MAIFSMLFIGLILSGFNIDDHFVKAVKEWTGKEITVSTWWMMWFILGFALWFYQMFIL